MRPHNVSDPAFRQTVTIAASGSASGSVDISKIGPRGLAVTIPSAWTGADLGVQYSDDNSTWYPVRNEEGDVAKITNIKTNEASGYAFPASAWMVGIHKYVRVVSLNTSAATTDWTVQTQSAARSIELGFLS